MTDYAATAAQPIAQALVEIAGAPGGAVSLGAMTRGFSSVARDPAALGQGAFILQLDPGLIGNAGAVDANEARAIVTPRGAGAPPASGVSSVSVAYLAGAPGIGSIAVEVTMQNVAGLFVDPAGLEWELVLLKAVVS